MSRQEDVTLGVSVRSSTHRLIKTYAALTGESIKDIVRDALEQTDWAQKVKDLVDDDAALSAAEPELVEV